jgi:hypothetical protein
LQPRGHNSGQVSVDATFDFAPSTDAAPRKSRVKHGIENLLEVESD